MSSEKIERWERSGVTERVAPGQRYYNDSDQQRPCIWGGPGMTTLPYELARPVYVEEVVRENSEQVEAAKECIERARACAGMGGPDGALPWILDALDALVSRPAVAVQEGAKPPQGYGGATKCNTLPEAEAAAEHDKKLECT